MKIPAYSVDLNPIENVWSLAKDKLHKHYPELYLIRVILLKFHSISYLYFMIHCLIFLYLV